LLLPAASWPENFNKQQVSDQPEVNLPVRAGLRLQDAVFGGKSQKP
jgi:hypothetical protein